jgi:hypothetical protein
MAMAAMNATPASTPTGRSQLTPSGPAASRRSRGQELGHGSELGRGRRSGHAQWPRQTQYRAQLKAPPVTASSHG